MSSYGDFVKNFFINGPHPSAKISSTGRILEINSRMVEFLGYSELEMTQMMVREILVPDYRDIDKHRFAELTSKQTTWYKLRNGWITKVGSNVFGMAYTYWLEDEENVYGLTIIIPEDEPNTIQVVTKENTDGQLETSATIPVRAVGNVAVSLLSTMAGIKDKVPTAFSVLLIMLGMALVLAAVAYVWNVLGT